MYCISWEKGIYLHFKVPHSNRNHHLNTFSRVMQKVDRVFFHLLKFTLKDSTSLWILLSGRSWSTVKVRLYRASKIFENNS